MEYYINKAKNTLIAVEGDEIIEFNALGGNSNNGFPSTAGRKTGRKPVVAGQRMTPQLIERIKGQLNAGVPIPKISEKLGVPAANIYYWKNKLEKKAVIPDTVVSTETTTRRPRMLPEKIAEIKARINQGDELDVIAEDFDVPKSSIIALKKKMDEENGE